MGQVPKGLALVANGAIGDGLLILPRKKYVLVLMVIAVLSIALFLWSVVPKDQASHITSSQAVQLFEQRLDSGPQSPAVEGQWPELGVYRYETHGHESIDTRLLDASHDYGGVSTVTLWPTRCGMAERWQVLATRWTEWETCGAEEGKLSSLREFHQFFGVTQEDSFDCSGLSAVSVAKDPPRRPTVEVCRSSATVVASRLQAPRAVRMEVAGEEVAAVRIEGTTTAAGESVGSVKFSEWRRRSDGLLLRRTSSRAIDSSANGGFHYEEGYSIELLSLSPER